MAIEYMQHGELLPRLQDDSHGPDMVDGWDCSFARHQDLHQPPAQPSLAQMLLGVFVRFGDTLPWPEHVVCIGRHAGNADSAPMKVSGCPVSPHDGGPGPILRLSTWLCTGAPKQYPIPTG